MDLRSCFDKAAKTLSSLFLPPPPEQPSPPSPLCTINNPDGNLKNLRTTMHRIQALIRDSEENRSSTMHTERLRLKELKDVAYDAVDLLDLHAYYVLQAQIQALDGIGAGPSHRKRKLASDEQVFTIPNEILEKAGKILMEFDNINSQWDNLKLWDTDGDMKSCVDKNKIIPTSSFFHEADVIGRMDDKEKVIEILFRENIVELCTVSVLPIVGMAGIGKTTLTQLVYNDPRIRNGFDLHGWVFVGGNFDVETVTKKIIATFTNENCDLAELNELHKKLEEVVRGKKFFLVLDDVSNDTARDWGTLLAPLVRAQSGRIVVTAHDKQVAKIRQTKPFYSLNYLPYEDCWSIFKQLVSGDKNQDPSPELLEIGRSIVEKCEGLPLAVKAIATALLFENEKEKWNEVLTSELWELSESKDGISPAVKLSYDRMPIYLKQCFVFFSLFPKGYLFSKDKMIRLWMSLGLCDQFREKEYGGMCIGGLLRRSMIQNGESMGDFSLHNILHDFVRSIAGEDFMRINDEMLIRMKDEIIEGEDVIREKRYLAIIHNLESFICLDTLNESKKLRILKLIGSNNRFVDIRIPSELFLNLTHLRALDFSNAAIKTLPESIGNLIQLRYLILTNTGIQNLPETICYLYNLQTLDLMRCPIQELPEGIKNLVKLRHLSFESSCYICMPHGIGRLKDLRTLPRFDIGKGSWHCKLSELKELVNLRGELCIGGLENVVVNDEEALKVDLQSKKVDILRFEWSNGNSRQCEHDFANPGCSPLTHHHERLLKGLRPNSKVKELHIYKYCGSTFPSWLGDASFTNLVKISLVGGAEVCESLPSLGQLPSLKTLSIHSLWGVRCVGHEFYVCHDSTNWFRSLEYLEFFDMLKLTHWLGSVETEFGSLKTLRIIDCPVLVDLPFRLSSSLTKLVIKDCDELAKLPTLPSLKSLTLKGQLTGKIFSTLDFPSLTMLKICHSSNIRSLCVNNQGLLLLEILVIHSCRNLQLVSGFSYLKTLKLFKVCKCHNAKFDRDEEIPPSLKQLDISDCPMLNGWKLFHEKKITVQLNENDGFIDEELEALAELNEAGSEISSENDSDADADVSG